MATVNIDLSKAYKSLASEPLLVALNQCVASAYVLGALARAAHWNVEGATFHELHETFGEIYSSADTATDDLAERIRQLGPYVQVNLAEFQRGSGITIPSAPLAANEWVSAVLAGLGGIITNLAALKAAAGAAGDLDTQDIGIEFSRVFSKHSWMVRSLLR